MAYERKPIQTTRILAGIDPVPNDTWKTQVNNNDLIIGPSGAGKTRYYVKPNLLQCALEGDQSLIIADTKGSLVQEVGPLLKKHGYQVISLDFTDFTNNNEWGYNPLRYIRYNKKLDKYSEQDILSVAQCLNPVPPDTQDPFWDESAQLFLSALISYVLEALPEDEFDLGSVAELYRRMEDKNFPKLMDELAAHNPASYAARTYALIHEGQESPKTYSSIKMMINRNLVPLTLDELVRFYRLEKQISFRRLGKEPTAVFLTISDTDRSMDKLVNLFYTQALQELCDSADKDYPQDHRLPVPVRFILDDFATNTVIPDFDNIISVIRSREIYVSLIIQSINQLYSLYTPDKGKTIINNCDNLLYLGGQDQDTADFIAAKTDRPKSSILSMNLNDAWLFIRGRKPQRVKKYDLTSHPLYQEYHELNEKRKEYDGAVDTDLEELSAANLKPAVSVALDNALSLLQERERGGASIALTKSEFSSQQNRKRQIKDRFTLIVQAISGRNTPMQPLTDGAGQYDDARAWALVDQLLACTRFSRGGLETRDEAFLNSFFYCAVRLTASRPYWLSELKGTWQDLLCLARGMEDSTQEDVYFYDLCYAPENSLKYDEGVYYDGGVFSWMDDIYGLLTGESIAQYITSAERQTVWSHSWDKLTKLKETLAAPPDEDPNFEYYDEDAYYEVQSLDDPFVLGRENLWKNYVPRARTPRQKEWVEAFAEPECFCQHYLLLRRIFFDSQWKEQLADTVEDAVDILLQECAASRYLSDETFTFTIEELKGLSRRLGGQTVTGT